MLQVAFRAAFVSGAMFSGEVRAEGVKYFEESSGMDLEGEQLLRVHVVEGTQVGQLEQQFGEDGGLVGVVLGDEAPQGADKRLLQGLHRVHVLDARSIWERKR